jgi:hypothetical protein
MQDGWIATTLGLLIPFIIYLFWILVFVAIVWGIIKLVKKLDNKKGDK